MLSALNGVNTCIFKTIVRHKPLHKCWWKYLFADHGFNEVKVRRELVTCQVNQSKSYKNELTANTEQARSHVESELQRTDEICEEKDTMPVEEEIDFKDASLPQLPVPPLQETVSKLFRSAEPLLTKCELCHSKNMSKEITAYNSEGEKLQVLLEEKASESDNWLNEWWVNIAYLSSPLPLVVYSNPAIQMPRQVFRSREMYLTYVAKLIVAVTKYRILITRNELPLDTLGGNDLDMSNYPKMFGTCRIPGIEQDHISYLNGKRPRHIVVAHNNQFFMVTVLTSKCQPLTEYQIKGQLQMLVQNSLYPETPVGLLTTLERRKWAELYLKLREDECNRCSLEIIEKSLFMVCLDNKAPVTVVDPPVRSALQVMHGGGSAGSGGNRWYDKTLQFIVGCGGEVGLNFEHSAVDCTVITKLIDFINFNVENRLSGFSRLPKPQSFPMPVKIELKLTEELEEEIGCAKEYLDMLVDDLELSRGIFTGFGKNFVKSHNLSPDSFIQMALQLAFYKLHKEPGSQYEVVTLRKFYLGRSEVVRSCSKESVEFCKTMTNSCMTATEKLESMRAAIEYHKTQVNDAMNGHGIDNHLLGLKTIAIENGLKMPDLYNHVCYIRSSYMRISTRQAKFYCNGLAIYGPRFHNGYGCCYTPHPSCIGISVTALRSDPEMSAAKMYEHIVQSLQEMSDILLSTQQDIKGSK